MQRTRQHGVAIIEFALVLPLLLVLTFITVEFGRAVYEYHTLTRSVRNAARYLSTQQANTRVAEAKNLVVYGVESPTSSTPKVLAQLAPDRVSATWGSAGTSPPINTVTVTVSNYAFQSLVVNAFGLDLGPLTFPAISATMRGVDS